MTRFELILEATKNSVRSRWPILTGLVLVLHAVIGGVALFTPRFTASIANSAIAPELGVAYSAAVDFGNRSIYVLPSDTNDAPDDSRLTLFENGHALGPSHALHAEIRERGGGRYSHWGSSIIFSTSDGSDPRTNGRVYSMASRTEVSLSLRIVFSAVLVLMDTVLFLLCGREILLFLRTRASVVLITLALAAIAAAGLSALGVFGTLVVANGGMPGDATLSIQALLHACLGCLISVGTWAAGAGVSRLVLREPHAPLAQVLMPALPVGLVLLAALATISLAVPQGRTVAITVWALCLLPLFSWRPPRHELRAAVKAALGIVPFAIAFGTWLGLLWHGPTQTLSGSPSGDLTYYAGIIWSIADHPYPWVTDLGYENGAARSYFNSLFPALGAALLYLPGFDPFLYLLASGGTSYLLLSTLMLHVYVADRPPRPVSGFAVVVLVLAFVVAARYPYWVVESIPVVFVPALTIAVWWMAERGGRAFGWAVAAMVAGLSGSILSKVATAAVLVPLGAAGVWRQLSLLPYSIRALALVVGCVFGAYSAAMLWHYVPIFVGQVDVGPESSRNPHWWFVSRDIGTLLLALLAWLVADGPIAVVLTIGLLTFLLFSFVFQINFVCVTLVLGLIMFAGPIKFAQSRPLALVALGLALPAAMLSDPAGTSSGVIWVICLGGAALIAVFSAVEINRPTSSLAFRTPAAIGLTTLLVTGLGLVGVARGHIVADSGWNRVGPQLTPELANVWAAVGRLTPHDALIFTDQVDETINVLGGWNTYAFRGQRQIYLSSYYTTVELRRDRARLREVLAINESVLNGTRSLAEVPTRTHYEAAFAVISNLRPAPADWKKLYSNKDYAIFKIP